MSQESNRGGTQKYLVRDPQGNVYGPADGEMLRAWVREGRIVPGMHIAPRETREWVEVTTHPEVAGELAVRAAELGSLQQVQAAAVPVEGKPMEEASRPAESPPPEPGPAAELPGNVPEASPRASQEVVEGEVEPPADRPVEAVEMVPVTQWLPEEESRPDPRHASGEASGGRAGGASEAIPAQEPAPAPAPLPMPAPFGIQTPQPPAVPTPVPTYSSAPLPPPTGPAHPWDPGVYGGTKQNVLGVLSITFGALGLALSCGACGCFVLWPLAGLLSVGAIVLGAIGVYQINQNPLAYRGKGLAVAGIALGLTTILLAIVMVILVFVGNFKP